MDCGWGEKPPPYLDEEVTSLKAGFDFDGQYEILSEARHDVQSPHGIQETEVRVLMHAIAPTLDSQETQPLESTYFFCRAWMVSRNAFKVLKGVSTTVALAIHVGIDPPGSA